MPTLSDVAGSVEFVRLLRERVVEPMRKGAQDEGKRIIVYGPPGTGKTFIAKALAGELGLGFKALGPSDDANTLKSASQYASSQTLVFFDSLEWVNYRPLYREVLIRMPREVLVVGATNYPWRTTALAAEGFNSLIFMPQPDREARLGIFKHHIGVRSDGLDVPRLADMTDGYTASDIYYLFEWALTRGHVTQERLEAAVKDYRTVQLEEWVKEAKANAGQLDLTAYAPLHEWLQRR